MNLPALKSEVQTDPKGLGYAPFLPDVGGQVTALINAMTQTMIQSRFVTARTVLSEISGGAALLDKLQSIGATQSAVKYAMTFLNQDSGIDIGNPATQTMIDQLIAGTALSPTEGAALKNLALRPASRAMQLGYEAVSHADIMAALLNDDGTPK